MATDTRKKIIDAATKLFAAADSRGASLRAIAREAEVNSALVHYHFGTREALFEAAILEALTPIQIRREKLIGELSSAGAASNSSDLARLFAEPLLLEDGADRQRHAMQLRLLSRVFSEQRALIQDLTVKHFGEVMNALGDFLGNALPGVPIESKYRRMQFCVEVALESLASFAVTSLEAEMSEEDETAQRNIILSDLIDFLAGGLSAPATI